LLHKPHKAFTILKPKKQKNESNLLLASGEARVVRHMVASVVGGLVMQVLERGTSALLVAVKVFPPRGRFRGRQPAITTAASTAAVAAASASAAGGGGGGGQGAVAAGILVDRAAANSNMRMVEIPRR
jgi:hypothetical protein